MAQNDSNSDSNTDDPNNYIESDFPYAMYLATRKTYLEAHDAYLESCRIKDLKLESWITMDPTYPVEAQRAAEADWYHSIDISNQKRDVAVRAYLEWVRAYENL